MLPSFQKWIDEEKPAWLFSLPDEPEVQGQDEDEVNEADSLWTRVSPGV